jgi:DNA-binding NtrC family response regulator
LDAHIARSELSERTMDDSISHDELVLVVDDERAIREAVRDILEYAGISTLLAANGQEAIDLFLRDRRRIRAILLDMRMPVMSGAETYARLRDHDREVAVILSTGFDDSTALIDSDGDKSLHFLRKPYSMDSLLAMMRQVLG